MLLDAQLHGAGDGLTVGVDADDLAALLVSRASIPKVLEHDDGAGLVCALIEGLLDALSQRGFSGHGDNPGRSGDLERSPWSTRRSKARAGRDDG
jgi:hypothetical protein